MFNVVPRVNCVTYWLVTYTRAKRKDRPFIFMLKFMRKNHNFLQSTIENQQKGCYLMSRSTPGTLCLRTRSPQGTLFLNAQNSQGTQIKLHKFLKHSGTQINSTRSTPGLQTNSTRCATGHQITSFLLIFNC